MYNRTAASSAGAHQQRYPLAQRISSSSPHTLLPPGSHKPNKNVVNMNKFHSVPVQLHPGDAPGLPSAFAVDHPTSSVALLQEPFVDQQSLHTQALLDRIALLMVSKDRAVDQLVAARDALTMRTIALMQASDAAMLPSLHNPGDATHEQFVRSAMDELRSLRNNVELLANLHHQCAANLKAAERELWSSSRSAELLLAARDVDEERVYLSDAAAALESPGLESPHSRPLTPSTAAAAAGESDIAAERAALERMNRESQHVALLDMALRIIRNPTSLWGKSDRGKEVLERMCKLQSHVRGHQIRRRYDSLKRARRGLDRESLRYQFYFFRRYVAAVRMDRLRLKKLGFYPLLGYSNLARLRRGAFILHATRARDNATLQRVFLLWRQLSRYQNAPLATVAAAATPQPGFGQQPSTLHHRKQSMYGGGSMAQKAMSRRWTVQQLQPPSAAVAKTPVLATSPVASTSPSPVAGDAAGLVEEMSGIVSVASLASGHFHRSPTPPPPPPAWWLREAPFQYDLAEWDVFLAQEHLRKALQRIALPVFGGASNHLLMIAHVWRRWREYIKLEKKARASWITATQHERKQCKTRHFMAWMDVVSFTAQKAAQCTAKLILYFGVWRRLVQRSCHEQRATAALLPLKKAQVLNRWRQRVVRLRLQRAASNLLLFAYRPIVLMSVHTMLDNRQQVVVIKLWRWWREYTQRRRVFQSLIGVRWQKRSQQLARLVLVAWRNAVDVARGSPPTRLGLASPNAPGQGSATTMPSYVHPSSVLFAPQTNDFGEDVRQLKQRTSMMGLFRSYHAASDRLERLGPAPITTISFPTAGGRVGEPQDVSYSQNPLDLIVKEFAAVPSLQSLGDAGHREIGAYHAWFRTHTMAVTVVAPPRSTTSAHSTNYSGDQEDSYEDQRGGGTYSWSDEAAGMMLSSKRCFKDKHFLANVFHYALQRHKREKQAAAYRQLTSSASTAPTPSASAAVSSSVAQAAADGNIDDGAAASEGVSSPTLPNSAAAALATRQTLALSFILGVGYPLATVATTEWNVTAMEHAFEDYHDYNLVIERRRHNRDGRIERKIDMRLAALRFADQNPFFTCYPLSVRNIGFSPYQALVDEYDLIVNGGKKARKASPKKKKKESSASGDQVAGGGSKPPVRKNKYRIPLPPVPARRQLPYLIRLHMGSLLDTEESQQRMLQQMYIRAKIQLMGVLLKLRTHHPQEGPRVLEAVLSREALVQRYTAAEEKNFVPAVVARKMQSLVAPEVAAKVERLAIDVQVLNITGFNPKFLRGTMQQKTRRIGLIRAAMKREGKWFHRTMQAKCILRPTAQWAMRRRDLEERILEEANRKDERDDEDDGENNTEGDAASNTMLLSADVAPLRPLGIPFPERLGKGKGALQLFGAASADDAFSSPFTVDSHMSRTNNSSHSGSRSDDDNESSSSSSSSDDNDDDAAEGGGAPSWRPTRALSCVHLSEAIAAIERNELWFRGVCAVPSSCPDSPLPRELVLRAPPPLELELEAAPESARGVVEGAADEAEGVSSPGVAGEGADTNPLTPPAGDLTTIADAGTTEGFSPFIGADGTDAAANLALQLSALGEGDSQTTSATGTARSRGKGSNAVGGADDDFTTSDSEDDDPRMVAARQRKPADGKAPRTLAERTKSTRSVLGAPAASQSLRKASVAREKSERFMPPADNEGASVRRDDDEEMVDEPPQPDATVDAFACAAMVNDGTQGAGEGGQGNPNANLAAMERDVAETLKEGVLKYTDGTYRLKDGALVVPGPPVRLILANGDAIDCPNTDPLMLARGNVRLTDGRIVPLGFAEVVDGQLKLQPNCMILADGTAVRLDGNAYRRDGKVRLASGRLVDAGRAAVGDDGRLMLASEKFLVQSGSSSEGSRRSKRSSGEGNSDDDDDDTSSEDEKGLDAQYGLATNRSNDGSQANHRLGGAKTLSSQHIKQGAASLFRHRRAPWTGGRVPRVWTAGPADPPSVPAMERLVEISARFNGYLNSSTRHEMSILKQFVLKALTKIDPDIAKQEKEARLAARRLSSLRGLRHGRSTHSEDEEEASAVGHGVTVQPTEFRITNPPAGPPAPTVTIESARKRQQPATAASLPTALTGATTALPSGTTANNVTTTTPPQSAPSNLGGGATKRYIPPAVLHGGLVSGEPLMVVMDPLPARRDGAQYVRQEESGTVATMRSTAELLNEARGPTSLSDQVAYDVKRGNSASSAMIDAIFRKHPRKQIMSAPLPPAPPAAPVATEGTSGGPPHAPSPARLPQKLRTSVADHHRPHSSTSSDQIIVPQAVVASPNGDRASFTQWLESLQRLQHNFASRDAANDTLRMQHDVLHRRIANLQKDLPDDESEESAAGRRLLLAEVRYRLDAIDGVLTVPCPLQTTTELLDGAIQKRSFLGSATSMRHRSARDTGASSDAATAASRRYGLPPTTHRSVEPMVGLLQPNTPTVLTKVADVEPLSDAEVGRLVGYLRKGAPSSAPSQQTRK